MKSSSGLFIHMFFVGAIISSACCLNRCKQRHIDEMVEAAMGCRDMMGAQIVAVKDGKTVFSKGYGLLDEDRPDKVTPKTMFAIASVTKQFTATLLGIVLEEKG